jgi:hypothetical protein
MRLTFKLDKPMLFSDLINFKQWLFGVEVTDSMIIFCDKHVIFVASPKKLSFFKQVRCSLSKIAKIWNNSARTSLLFFGV